MDGDRLFEMTSEEIHENILRVSVISVSYSNAHRYGVAASNCEGGG